MRGAPCDISGWVAEELAEDAWEPAELVLDDHDGQEEELGPQETPGSAGTASDLLFVREPGSAGSGPASWSGYCPCGLCTDGDRRRRSERWRATRLE